jgi:FkbM family methyltransferase
MIERVDCLDLCMPGPKGLVHFTFTTGGDRDHIAHWVCANGLQNYEAPTPDVIVGLISDSPDLVLDIGASSGIYTLLVAAANDVARVCAFEPLQAARELLKANIVCNPDLVARITVEPVALSGARGTVPFFETINDQGLLSTSSSLEFGHACQVGPHIRYDIETETLDDWSDGSGQRPVQLMKIDVEGHEHAVIEGGRRTLARHRPIIIAEVLGAANFVSLSQLQTEHGYRDFTMSPGGVRARPDIRFHPDSWNHLLCPLEKIDLVAALCQRLSLDFEADPDWNA